MPRPSDSMLMTHYGTLSLQFNIPRARPLTFNIALTMGRLGYSVQAHAGIAKRIDLPGALQSLAGEIGLRCDERNVGEYVRFEFCNEPSLVWASTTLNILQTPQVEDAFKEFVMLQVDRLIIGIANLLAAAGLAHQDPPGIYAICMLKKPHNEEKAESTIKEIFKIVFTDARDPQHIIYALVCEDPPASAVKTCRHIEHKLREQGFECSFRPTWIHRHPSAEQAAAGSVSAS